MHFFYNLFLNTIYLFQTLFSSLPTFLKSTPGKICSVILITYIATVINAIVFKKVTKKESIYNNYAKAVIRFIIIVLGIVSLLNCFETTKQFTSVVLFSSSLLIAVLGFAAQEVLGIVLNGLFISLFKPFEIGDRVNLLSNNITGYIEDISVRHTVLRTFSNSRILIPNNVMNKEIIENSHFRESKSGGFLDVTITYESDIRLAISIIQECVENHPLFIDTRTNEDILNKVEKVPVFIRDLAQNGVMLRTNVWTSNINTNFKACSDIRLQIKESFDTHNIRFAYPHVHLIQDKI